MKLLLALTATLSAASAMAHEGHGLEGAHWHATDVLGFVGVAAVLVVAIWTSRK